MPVEALFSISEPGQAQAKKVCKGRAVGIDLGTTNSLVAAVQAGRPVCLGEGEELVPFGGSLWRRMVSAWSAARRKVSP